MAKVPFPWRSGCILETTSATLLNRLHDKPDQAAWQDFAQLYSPMVYAWGRRLGLSDADANDLTQDVLLTLLRQMPEFRYDPQKSFRGWLRTVAVNRARDFLRRAHHKNQPLEGAEYRVAEDFDEVAFISDREYEQALSQRVLAFIRTAFEETTWKACWLTVVEGRLPADVAGELGITVNAVYLAKARVLRRLRLELAVWLD